MKKFLAFFTMLMLCGALASAQTHSVKGHVTGPDGASLPGITVQVKGTNTAAATDANGQFEFAVPSNATLEFTGVGFATQRIKVGALTSLNITLQATSEQLNEVIVTALGIKREKRQLTYSTQEVKGTTIIQAKQDNLVNALAGKVSGVQITNSSGMAGSSSRIVIRGNTSLLGDNQPLFVVDGVPIDNSEAGAIDVFSQGSQNTALNQGSTSNRAIDLDPSIIESITVLKGGAATALYGAAAARGAIIITTKSGARNSKSTLSISSSLKFDKAILAPYQTEYSQGLNGLFINGSIQGTASSQSWGARVDTLKVGGLPVKTYDPRDIFFRTGITTDNNVSVSGGSDKSNYLVSYSYLNDKGIIPTTSFARNSFFGKFSNQITHNLTVNMELNYINTVNHRTQEGNNYTNPLLSINPAPITWDPLPSTWPDGTQRLYRSLSRNNPFFLIDNSGFNSTINRFLPVASFTYTPAKWITITERIGTDIYTDNSRYFEANTINNGVFGNDVGGVSNRLQDYRQVNNDFIVNLHKTFRNDLSGSLILGNNILSRFSDTYTQSGIGLTIPNFYNISNGSSFLTSDYISKYRKVGFYAQGNLEYKKLLELSLTGRYDGTSVLNINKNWYPYGSAGFGFIFTELMHKKSVLSFGKVRVSYSSVGNDNLSPYSLTTPYIGGSSISINNINFPYNGNNGFRVSAAIGNPNLKNESLNEFETGLELKFLNNRLSFEGSYFDRESKNLLSQIPINGSSGYQYAFENVGDIQNKGVEFLISGTPIKTKDFTWDVSLNFTRIRNKVLSLGNDVPSIQLGGFANAGVFLFKGQPYGVLYGLGYVKDSKSGKIEVDDNGIPIASSDYVPIGNTNPDFTAGMSNTFTYKNFSLSFLFDWRQGGDILNLDDNYMWFYGTSKVTGKNRNKPFVVPNTVYASSGAENTTPVTAQDYWTSISSLTQSNIEDGTYIKLRNVTLAYTFGKINKIPIFKSFTFSLSGNNLWIYAPHFTGGDPEASVSGGGNAQGITNFETPTTRSFIVGVKATF